jgi:hypothetical protein
MAGWIPALSSLPALAERSAPGNVSCSDVVQSFPTQSKLGNCVAPYLD